MGCSWNEVIGIHDEFLVPERHARKHKKWIPRTSPGTSPGTQNRSGPGLVSRTGRKPINGRAAIFLTVPFGLVVVEDLKSGPWVCGLAPVFQDRS